MEGEEDGASWFQSVGVDRLPVIWKGAMGGTVQHAGVGRASCYLSC